MASFLYIILWVGFHRRKRAPGDLLVRGEKWLFSPKRGWWPIIFFTPPLCAVEIYKKIYVRKKSYREKSIRSHHSWTQNCLLGIMHPRNICNQCFFMPCTGVIKQTLNYSFWIIQYTCFVISSVMSKLCLLFRPNVAWTDGTNLSLIDEAAMIKWVTWENYLPNELSDLCFLLHISSHHNVEKNREKIKENLTTTSVTKESP